ncbi:hypothetical protein B296_00053969 [Ensete ventricosum]|uniref:Uncharacterized protein n=1 Tax=Ensete ventricosum TaxID=4639 RepID=A0A426XK80_ENSVE|nr:hypothetical protein B296_00053969 [Ensete ventricosum]
MALFDRVHDVGWQITFMDYRLKQLQEELDALKSDGVPEAVAKAEERAAELQEELERTRRERDEALLKHEASEKELHETIVEYKESLEFKEGLKRMGRVTYEYRYRVALARLHARYPDDEVKEDPFTIHPKDDLVPMQRQQVFDDSIPPEP